MIIMKIWGGLGNQLFQYALGYALAKTHDRELVLDMDFYTEAANRKPLIRECKLFYTTEKDSSPYDFSIKSFQHNKYYRQYQKILKKLGLGSFRYICELAPKYQENIFKIPLKSCIYYDGYWQSPKYFEDYAEDLRSQFVPKTLSKKAQELREVFLNSSSVALHVRRGDYLDFSSDPSPEETMYLLEKSYFEKAIEKINNLSPGVDIFCFSDDISWCKKELVGPNIHYIERSYGLTDFEEWHLMSLCKHQIVSNSTYSWWAAWLNSYSQKIVISPDRWFGNHDIFPSSWVKIPLEMRKV